MKKRDWLSGKEPQISPLDVFSKLIGSTWTRKNENTESTLLPDHIKLNSLNLNDLGPSFKFLSNDYTYIMMSLDVEEQEMLSYAQAKNSQWYPEECRWPISYINLIGSYDMDENQDDYVFSALILFDKTKKNNTL